MREQSHSTTVIAVRRDGRVVLAGNRIWNDLKNEHSLCCLAGAKKLEGLCLTLVE
jgi:hypothetical protein